MNLSGGEQACLLDVVDLGASKPLSGGEQGCLLDVVVLGASQPLCRGVPYPISPTISQRFLLNTKKVFEVGIKINDLIPHSAKQTLVPRINN